MSEGSCLMASTGLATCLPVSLHPFAAAELRVAYRRDRALCRAGNHHVRDPQSRLGRARRGLSVINRLCIAEISSGDDTGLPVLGLISWARDAVSRLRAVVKERVESSAEEADRVQTWLKSAQAKEFVRQSPELKESFSSAGTAAKTLVKEQAEALSAEESALGKIKSQLTAFRVK